MDTQTITNTNIADETITSTQIQDNSITAADIQDVFVLNTGDTVTGDLQVDGNQTIGLDLTVSGGNIGIGTPANVLFGIINDQASAPVRGALFYGSSEGIRAAWSGDPATHYAFLASQSMGVYGMAGASDETGNRYGAYVRGYSQGVAIGLYSLGYGFASAPTFGVQSWGRNDASGDVYGGHFSAVSNGTGTHYGVWADGGGDYAGWFEKGRVHVGDTGKEDHVDGDGDLYVEDVLEVDGGGYLYGPTQGVYAYWSGAPAHNYGYIGSSDTGVYGSAGHPGATGLMRGGYFISEGVEYSRGLYGIANAYGDLSSIGIFGMATNYSTGPAYGGYFAASTDGTGTHIGIRADGDDYSGWFQDGPVHVGDGGTEDYVDGDGDLYVEDVLEVDGPAQFSGGLDAPGAIDSSDIASGAVMAVNIGEDCAIGEGLVKTASGWACASPWYKNTWMWMSGDTVTYQNGFYGTKGTPDPANVPGGRTGSVSWIDASRNLWLFGGLSGGNNRLNDLWRWDGSNWTWMSGSNGINQNGVYGTKGTSDPANVPGGRYGAVSWTDSSGNMWLFGGYGFPASGSVGLLNDLWRWDGTNWTWMSGSDGIDQNGGYETQGSPDPANVPGGRWGAVSWIDSSGNMWLFGGSGYDGDGIFGSLNDLWRWDGTDWSWMSGSASINENGVYGIKGTPDPSNVPGGRYSAVSWTDTSGNFWLFGGSGYPESGGPGYLNDLWRWDGINWTWMSGSNLINQIGIYGTKGIPDPANVPGSRNGVVSWTDSSGNLWLFGGRGYPASGGPDYLNDRWRCDGTDWTWMSGSNALNQNGVYGTKGIPDPANFPGSRYRAVSWIDASGKFWLFGGDGYPASGGSGYLNDLWRYNP
jgi:hypothetical protein